MKSTFVFSEAQFYRGIHLIGLAFSNIEEYLDVAGDKRSDLNHHERYLHRWREENPQVIKLGSSESYLHHDRIALIDSYSTSTNDGIPQDHLWEDHQQLLEDEISIRTNDSSRIIEFSFSVCYSHVWCVPVLYFRVQDTAGRMISRKSLLRFINKEPSNVDDLTFDEHFISEEEHPVTGIPCFFLHPCQTPQRLYTLSQTMERNALDPDLDRFHALLILSWLSMVLPALNFRLSAYLFPNLVAKLETCMHYTSKG